MGLREWWHRRSIEQKTLDQQLLIALLEGEKARHAASVEVEKARAQVELRKLELEVENAEDLAKARNEEREFKAKLRVQQREWAQQARDRKKEKDVERERAAQPKLQNCPVCANASDPTLTAEMIMWHKNGHPDGRSHTPAA